MTKTTAPDSRRRSTSSASPPKATTATSIRRETRTSIWAARTNGMSRLTAAGLLADLIDRGIKQRRRTWSQEFLSRCRDFARQRWPLGGSSGRGPAVNLQFGDGR